MNRGWLTPALLACALLSACNSPVSALPGTVSTGTASSAPSLPSTLAQPAACVAVDGKADARCTPGLANPLVTQLDIGSTICRKGWTATIRPPVAYTNRLKVQQMPRYGLTGPPSLVEEDHLLALEIGGDPTDPRNLWPEAWNGAAGAHVKDAEENSLRRSVCGGRMKLADAQAKMLADWTHA